MNDETMDEQATDAEVTRLAVFAADRNAERAAAKGMPGLLEWMMTGRVL